MTLLVVDEFRQPLAPLGTSADGVLQKARDWVISVGGTLAVQGTSAAEIQRRSAREIVATEQTNSGLVTVEDETLPSTAIVELRRRSGLTWEQLSRLFGVARRSVHFWSSGKPMNAANEERLGRLLAVVRYIDRGSARATRTAIVTALPDGVIPFDLLLKDAFDDVIERLGAGPGSTVPTLPQLSIAAKAARLPLPPDERVGALQDTVHHEVGNSRASRAARIKSDRDGAKR
jgi:DNA-binding transcriptional regulator YiaG